MGMSFFRSSLNSVNAPDVKIYGSAAKDENGKLIDWSKGGAGWENVDTDTKKRRARELYIPIGLGLRYKLNQDIDLGLEITTRFYNSDKLDGVIATEDNDKYILTALTGTYKLGKQEEALVWSDPLTVLVNDVATNKKKINSMTADADGDGVADMFDKEAGTAEGAIVDGAGQTLDLKDNSDEVKALEGRVTALESAVPTTFVNEKGETVAKPTAGFAGYLPSVYFSSNSARLDSKGQAVIAEIAKSIGDAKSVTVVGNTDKHGTDAYNQKLGERRANAVINVLVSTYGFDKSIFTVVSKGETAEIGSASFANRRVDVLIK
jgi:OOP family OmpA-OmpF porin